MNFFRRILASLRHKLAGVNLDGSITFATIRVDPQWPLHRDRFTILCPWDERNFIVFAARNGEPFPHIDPRLEFHHADVTGEAPFVILPDGRSFQYTLARITVFYHDPKLNPAPENPA